MTQRELNPTEGFRPTDAQELYIDLKKILLATDGSRSALSATKYAIGLAKIFKAQIRAVFVCGNNETPSQPGDTISECIEASASDEPGYHGLVVAGVYALENDVTCEEIVLRGNTAKRIIESARDFTPDLIIIGNSKKSGIRRTLGSVADAVIKGTDIPVLVVGDV